MFRASLIGSPARSQKIEAEVSYRAVLRRGISPAMHDRQCDPCASGCWPQYDVDSERRDTVFTNSLGDRCQASWTEPRKSRGRTLWLSKLKGGLVLVAELHCPIGH